MARPLVQAVAFSLLTLSPAVGLAQGNKGKVTSQPSTPQDYAVLAKMSGLTARVVTVNPAANALTFQVEIPVPEVRNQANNNVRPNNYRPNNFRPNNAGRNNYRPNAGRNAGRGSNSPQAAAQAYRQMIQQQQRLAQQQMQMMQRLAQQMQQQAKNAQNVTYNVVAKEFSVTLDPGARVARRQLTVDYDEKGNLKKYTAEEAKKLRDPSLPGYKASLDEVLPGEMVFLYFGKEAVKGAQGKDSPDAENAKAGGAAKADVLTDILGREAGADPARPAGGGPVVHGILILSDPDVSRLPNAPAAAKKNKK